MELIPVIDLLDGVVVRAIAGQREHYQPMATSLCASSDPAAVINAYLSLADFQRFYIADLNAITGQRNNCQIIDQLSAAFPTIEWWIDSGFARADQLDWAPTASRRPVLGSESQDNIADYSQLLMQTAEHRPILSLDFKNGEFLGPKSLLNDPAYWPDDIIVMQLDRVGVDGGPAIGKPAQAEGVRYFAAGGVRSLADLETLQAAQFAGVLVASALHDGKISRAELATFTQMSAD